MPTERCGKIGYLLRHGKAHVVSRVPFVVQLDYDSTTYTQDVSLGIDAGSKHIGVSASSEKKEMLAAQVELRSDIVKLLSTRRELRRNRRNRKTRYRKARFDNRKKKDGWLAPSVEQKIESHLKVIRFINYFLSRRPQSRSLSLMLRKSKTKTSMVKNISKENKWDFGT